MPTDPTPDLNLDATAVLLGTDDGTEAAVLGENEHKAMRGRLRTGSVQCLAGLGPVL